MIYFLETSFFHIEGPPALPTLHTHTHTVQEDGWRMGVNVEGRGGEGEEQQGPAAQGIGQKGLWCMWSAPGVEASLCAFQAPLCGLR